jgi:hypothetical protein
VQIKEQNSKIKPFRFSEEALAALEGDLDRRLVDVEKYMYFKER